MNFIFALKEKSEINPMTVENRNTVLFILCYAFALLLFFISSNHSLFWDTVHYGSIQPNYYFSTNFENLFMPNEMDSGEVPFFAIYIATMWKLFGKSLEVSHFAILPFVLGVLCQLSKLCKKFIKSEFVGIAFLLIIVDTTLLSQITLVSPDIPLLFFFLLGLNAVLDNNKTALSISIIFLSVGITRGLILSFCLFIFDLYHNVLITRNRKNIILELLKRSVLFLPGLLIFLLYNYFHYILKGWVFTYEESPWIGTKELVDFKGFLVNIGYLCWRLVDFGKVIIWAIILFLILKLKSRFWKLPHSKPLAFLSITLLFFCHVDMLWAKNLLAHRYFIPVNICISLLCSSILFSETVSNKTRRLLVSLWFVFLISGSFWIYPDKIAKGWDSTLAHLPYYNLRLQAIDFLERKDIDFTEVQSFFPNVATIDAIDLNGDQRNFDNFDGSSRYVFYSNIFNVSDEEYDKIHDVKNYKSIKQFERNGVVVSIFEKQN